MIKDEKINRRKALLRVDGNIKALKAKEQTLSSIYEIIFSRPNFTYLEVLNSYTYSSITYGEVDTMNKKFANYFKKHIGGNTKYVGLLLDNSKEWLYSFYGLILAGFSPVLLSTANLISDSKFAIEKLNIEYVVTNKEVDDVKIINPFELDLSDETNDTSSLKASNEIVFLTSGTSGTPKIVFYTGKEICEQLYNAAGIIKKEKNIGKSYKGYLKQLVILPFYHMFGLFAMLLWFSFFNVTFVMPKDLSPLSIRQACLLAKPTHIFAVPLFFETIEKEIYRFVKDNDIEKKFNKGIKISRKLQSMSENLGNNIVRNILFKKYLKEILGNSVRFCISGGAFISNSTLSLMNSLGYKLCNGYGSTEIGITSFSDASSFKARCFNSIGKPFDGITYKIENNELLVKGASISKHIIDKDNEIFINEDDFINTHDISYVKDDSYHLNGRLDEIIIGSNGENISLSSLENDIKVLANEFALVSKDEKIYLVLSYSRQTKAEDILKDIEGVKSQVVSKYISDYFVSYQPLPKANGLKIKRNELANTLSSLVSLKDLKEKQNELDLEIDEKLLNKVINAYKKLFNNKEITRDSNFYTDLGGDSFRYFILLNEIEKETEVKMNLVGISNVPLTPAEFTKFIEGVRR